MKRIKTFYRVSPIDDEKTCWSKFAKTKRMAIKKATKISEKYGSLVWICKYTAHVNYNKYKKIPICLPREAFFVEPSTQAKVARKLRGD